MDQHPIQFLPQKQAKQMEELAERARQSLSRFAGVDVKYDSVGLQMLDEWIDRHLRQFPKPSQGIVTVWGAFLGEVFRRRFNGEWVLDNSEKRQRLGVVCPKTERGLLFIDVMDQIKRRLQYGMSESLAFYFALQSAEIRER